MATRHLGLTWMAAVAASLAASLAVACSTEPVSPAPADAADGAAETTGETSGDTQGDTAAPMGPLLDQPGAQTHACKLLQKDAVSLEGYSSGATMAALADGFVVAQCRNAGFGGEATSGVFGYWAGATGKPGSAFPIAALKPNDGWVSDCQSASAGGSWTVAWTQAANLGGQVYSARVSADGKVSVGPIAVPGTADNSPRVYQLIPSGDNTLVIWGTSDTVKTTLLGPDLKPIAAASSLPPAWSYNLRGVLNSNGFVIFWDQSSDSGWTEVWAVQTDAGGKPSGSPWRVSAPATAKLSTSLGDVVPLADGFLAAMTLRKTVPGSGGGFGQGSMAQVTALQRLDGGGKLLGPLQEVQPTKADFESVDPALKVVGPDVVLTWAQGKVIYICGGCIGDHDLRFVRLHGAELSTASNVLDLPKTGINGLKRPELAAQGDRLGVIYDIDFHAMTKSGAALLQCTAK